MASFRNVLLQHTRFKWISVERQKLESNGVKKGGAIDTTLLLRSVQSCKNEVLGIIHRSFYENIWRVHAKFFDGVIV